MGCRELDRVVCGDGERDAGEACDDGEDKGLPGYCDRTCSSLPYCGDGIVEGAEECDEGDRGDGDGCSSACRIEDADTLGWLQMGGWEARTTRSAFPALPAQRSAPEFTSATSPTLQEPATVGGACAAEPDIMNIFPATFAQDIDKYICHAGTPEVYFPGIQSEDDPTRLIPDWDVFVGDLYVDFAVRGAMNQNSSHRHWMLVNYYNEHHKELEKKGKNLVGGSVEVIVNEIHSKRRTERRGYLGVIQDWGDLTEVRMMGLWLAMPDENFIRYRWPGGEFGGSNAALRARNQHDFELFIRDRIENNQWQKFVVKAAQQVAQAIKCHKALYAHSGGGASLGLVLKLLALKYPEKIRQWADDNNIFANGFEAVLSNAFVSELENSDFSPYQNLIVFRNGIWGVTGSIDTWQGTIGGEMQALGQRAFSSHPVPTADINAVIYGGHAMIGLYPLEFGQLPQYPFGP